jgi:pimeloyl-ACP methyl ester carboxylesterase
VTELPFQDEAIAVASTSLRLCMIPGSSTDKRMYAPQQEQFPDMVIPEWILPLGKKEPLSSYANRLAATIDTSSPFILGGVSLGGMIAQEMASQLKPVAVLLIATSSTSCAIPLRLRLAGRFTRWSPNFMVKLMLLCMSLIASKATSLKHAKLYAQMFRDLPPKLVRWQSGAATEWSLKEPLNIPVFHIHGVKDPIIPCKNVKPNVVIENGGHLINVTHADRINSLIADCYQRYS